MDCFSTQFSSYNTRRICAWCERTTALVRLALVLVVAFVVVVVAFVVGFVVDGSNKVDTGRTNGRTKGADGARRCLDVLVECFECLECLEVLEVLEGFLLDVLGLRVVGVICKVIKCV